MVLSRLDQSEAVTYHYGKFPPKDLSLPLYLEPLLKATGKFGAATASRFRIKLLEVGILSEVKPPAGRRSEIYRFDFLRELAKI